jgi:hypothetical protein
MESQPLFGKQSSTNCVDENGIGQEDVPNAHLAYLTNSETMNWVSK